MSDSTIANIVSAFIARHGLLDKCHTYLVALSGGADSVALLLLLLELGYDVEGVHCNFHLRGEESDRDESFVKQLCSMKNVPLHFVHFETREYASLHKISIEMAARQLRYAYFEQLRNDINADAICVAHHRNDNVETVIMNLLRGTGIHGLAGIKPRNGRIVRPLLCVSRSEIENYLEVIGQDYVTDSTNLVPDVTRNKIRLELLPLMETINESAVNNIQRTAQYLSEAVKVYDDGIDKGIASVKTIANGFTVIDIGSLLDLPSPECVLFAILNDYGFTSSQVTQIFANISLQTGRTFSSGTYDLVFDRGKIVIATCMPMPSPILMPEVGTYIMNDGLRINMATELIDDCFHISRESNRVNLNAAKIRFPLTLRSVQAGDRFIPFGMKGSKLVSDYLTDCKMNVLQKKRQLVMTDASGNIVWLVGKRIDDRYKITNVSNEALVITVSKNK